MAPRTPGEAAGYSLVELLFVAGLILVVSAIAVPQVMAGIDDSRASGATHYVMARLHHARMLAISRSAYVGVKFVAVGGGFEFTMYADGNRDGIKSAEIAKGIDKPIESPQRLGVAFSGTEFGTLPTLPSADGGGIVDGDPIRLGSGDIASFAPDGTSSSGSLYVLGRGGSQYAVRIFGETGRIRMMKFNRSTRKWLAVR